MNRLLGLYITFRHPTHSLPTRCFSSTRSCSFSSSSLPPPLPTRALRRVVVTGMGCVTPLGSSIPQLWSRIVNSESGVRRITDSEINKLELAATVAAQVRRGTNTADGEFDLAASVPKSVLSQSSPFIHFALAATQQALDQSNWKISNDHDAARTGVAFGSGIGCIDESAHAGLMLKEKGKRGVSAYSIPKLLVNLAAGQISQ